jgi:hypothetical protein
VRLHFSYRLPTQSTLLPYAASLAYDIQTFGTLNRLLGCYLMFAFSLPILMSDVWDQLRAAFSLKKSEIPCLVSICLLRVRKTEVAYSYIG